MEKCLAWNGGWRPTVRSSKVVEREENILNPTVLKICVQVARNNFCLFFFRFPGTCVCRLEHSFNSRALLNFVTREENINERFLR